MVFGGWGLNHQTLVCGALSCTGLFTAPVKMSRIWNKKKFKLWFQALPVAKF